MGKVLIPIADHISGLHEGHKQVVNFSKEFSGDHTIKVVRDARNWRRYLLTGIPFTPKSISPKMLEDVNKTGMVFEEANIKLISETWRAALYNKAKSLVSLYDDAILIDQYKSRAILIVMGLFAFQHTTLDRNDILVRGPDLVSFFQNSVRKLIGGPEVKIYPQMIKNKSTKIREQGSMDYISSYYHFHIERLHSMIGGAKPYFKPGRNQKLVTELNDAYKSKPWKIHNIAVYEGGMVPGRLEVVLIGFPSADGIAMVDDISYYN